MRCMASEMCGGVFVAHQLGGVGELVEAFGLDGQGSGGAGGALGIHAHSMPVRRRSTVNACGSTGTCTSSTST